MISLGWDKKDNVKILFGRWQDVAHELTQYDGIFFDTYAGVSHVPVQRDMHCGFVVGDTMFRQVLSCRALQAHAIIPCIASKDFESKRDI